MDQRNDIADLQAIRDNPEEPLVSIIVITYNSAKYVLETLESAKAQTYRNIELIISDDCSDDNTVDLCNEWIRNNYLRFSGVKLLTSGQNTGIAPNCNRGLYSAKGDWIKLIAGDDTLLNDCIEVFIAEIHQKNDIQIIFSGIVSDIKQNINGNALKTFFELPAEDQFRQILKRNIIPVTGIFFKRQTAIILNGFDERFPMLEDYPFYLKALKNGIKLYGICNELVFYRVSDQNISFSKYLNVRYIKSRKSFFKQIYLKQLYINGLHLFFFHYLAEYFLQNLVLTGVIKKRSTYNSLWQVISIYSWQKKAKKFLCRA